MILSDPDTLSSLARKILNVNRESVYRTLTASGEGDSGFADELAAMSSSTLLIRPAKDTAAGKCAVAALWIWHGYLAQPHEIVQQIHQSMGSYWHGVIHRRERDFSNAKYWFSRAGTLTCSDTIAVRADDLLRTLPANKSLFRLTATGWNPDAFVDIVEAVANRPTDPRYSVAVSLQQVEWQVVFDDCIRAAAS